MNKASTWLVDTHGQSPWVSNAPEVLRTNLDAITYLFSGYDGRIFLRESCTLPWYGIRLKESRVQHIPIFVRT